jgi:hypothetical protein
METNYSNYNALTAQNYSIWAYHKKINPPDVQEENQDSEENARIRRLPIKSDIEGITHDDEIQQIIAPKKKRIPDNLGSA